MHFQTEATPDYQGNDNAGCNPVSLHSQVWLIDTVEMKGPKKMP